VALRDVQAKMVELGRVRTGQRVMNRAGTKLIPKKLDSFRFTSPAEHLIQAIAALYGGEVGPFTGEGVVGKQFGVITDVDDIPIYLPAQKIDPFYERWQGGVCVRRCDGERDMIHDKPCDCRSGEDRVCKPTTRINLMLADVPGIGVWRLESHGIYAAMELSQLAFLLERPPAPIPARLILELRQRKFFNQKTREVEVRDYYVPVVMVDAVTSRHVVMGGDALSQALRMTEGTPALEAASSAPALPAAPAPQQPKPVDPEMIKRALERIASATTGDELADIQRRIVSIGSPAELVEAWKARAAEIAEASIKATAPAADEPALVADAVQVAAEDAQQAPADGFEGAWEGEEVRTTSETAAPPAAPEAPNDVELAARKAAMMTLLGEAGARGMKMTAVNQLISDRLGKVATDATAAELTALAAELAGAPR